MAKIPSSRNVQTSGSGLAFASLLFVLSSIPLKSQLACDGLNSQASASDQQLKWERMLAGESAERYSLRGVGVPDGVPFLIQGKPAPDDFVDAQCIDIHGMHEPCKLKVDRTNQAIGVWNPPGNDFDTWLEALVSL